jgi:chromosome segregation ATPase
MSTDNKDQTTAPPDAGDNAQGTPTQGDGNVSGSNVDPKSVSNPDLSFALKKIADLEKDNKKYRDKISKDKAEQEKKAQKEAEEKGEFKKLYENLKAEYDKAKTPLESLRADLTTILEKELEALPPQKKNEFEDLFGDLDDPSLKLKKFQKWIGGNIYNKDSKTASAPPSSTGDDVKKLEAIINEGKHDKETASKLRNNIEGLIKATVLRR